MSALTTSPAIGLDPDLAAFFLGRLFASCSRAGHGHQASDREERLSGAAPGGDPVCADHATGYRFLEDAERLSDQVHELVVTPGRNRQLRIVEVVHVEDGCRPMVRSEQAR